MDPDTGAVTWVRAIGRTFYAADGTPTRFDGVTLDVTDRKRAELSLRESEERFRLMADARPRDDLDERQGQARVLVQSAVAGLHRPDDG